MPTLRLGAVESTREPTAASPTGSPASIAVMSRARLRRSPLRTRLAKIGVAHRATG